MVTVQEAQAQARSLRIGGSVAEQIRFGPGLRSARRESRRQREAITAQIRQTEQPKTRTFLSGRISDSRSAVERLNREIARAENIRDPRARSKTISALRRQRRTSTVELERAQELRGQLGTFVIPVGQARSILSSTVRVSERQLFLGGATRTRRLTPRQVDVPQGFVGVSTEQGTGFVPVGGGDIFIPRASAVGGGVIAESLSPIPSVGGQRQIVSLGLPSIQLRSLSDVETLGDFQTRQTQVFFQQEAASRLQSPLIDEQFQTGARQFRRRRFRELPRERQIGLIGGSLAVGGARVGTFLTQTSLPGFGGVSEPGQFQQSLSQRPVSTFFFGPEVEAFRPIRDRPGDIIQTGVQLAPLGFGVVAGGATLISRGFRGGIGTIGRGFAPLRTGQTFEQFSLRGLQAQPTRTFGLETGVDPITGGREFRFVSGREFGGATQVQTFRGLQVPRTGRPPRTVISEGEAVTQFRDPISGRSTGGVDFFTGGVDISRAGLPVSQRGLDVRGVTGALGRGRLFRPGTSEFQEFAVGGIGRTTGRRFTGVDIRPRGAGVRRGTISEFRLEPTIGRGGRLTSRDLARTDILPTRFIRGEPIGTTDILLTGRGGLTGTDRGFQTIVGRGRRGLGRRVRGDTLQTTRVDVGVTGIGELTRRVPTTIRAPRTRASTTLIPAQGAFTGTGLFERTETVAGLISRPPSQQALIGTGLRQEFSFVPLTRTGIGTGLGTRVIQQPRLGAITSTAQPSRAAQLQLQPPRLAELQLTSTATIPALQTPTRTTTRQPLIDPFFGRPSIRGGGFFGLGIPPLLGGSAVRGRRTRRRPARRTPLLPSFTAIVADVRGPLPSEISIGGREFGVLPGRIRRVPRRRGKTTARRRTTTRRKSKSRKKK